MSQAIETMPLKWRLAAVMADKEIDNQMLHESTGLHLGTISKLRNSAPKQINWETLESLCSALECEPGDLIKRV